MKRIVVLGSTGSVGRNVIEVAAIHRDQFQVVGFAVGSNVSLLREQCDRFPEALFAVGNEEAYASLVSGGKKNAKTCMGAGNGAIEHLITEAKPDLVVNCMVGFIGLKPTLAALESGIAVAIANKEAIVAGGEILVEASRRNGASIIPIDSEHVAISQCLLGHVTEEVKKVHITASGGALRDKPMSELGDAGVLEVLEHPTWKMGDKITVDSATMINKGLEVIEAHWLFGLPFEKIGVVIHPQSIVHSLVEYKNGSIIAQMSVPDMRLPILYALSFPERIETGIAPSKITDFPSLSFAEVEAGRYPCLELALEAAREGGNKPAVLNSANEEAVLAFLAGKISFAGIFASIRYALDRIPLKKIESLDDIMEVDENTRALVKAKLSTK